MGYQTGKERFTKKIHKRFDSPHAIATVDRKMMKSMLTGRQKINPTVPFKNGLLK